MRTRGRRRGSPLPRRDRRLGRGRVHRSAVRPHRGRHALDERRRPPAHRRRRAGAVVRRTRVHPRGLPGSPRAVPRPRVTGLLGVPVPGHHGARRVRARHRPREGAGRDVDRARHDRRSAGGRRRARKPPPAEQRARVLGRGRRALHRVRERGLRRARRPRRCCSPGCWCTGSNLRRDRSAPRTPG